eukprot:gnl/MRDRNA2_/MRDRNA2_99913_c0_seq1.p1 gnl/MRDRNA2_/MRDRNA2_99913_c0~~gnl/MRDRNA2_/MRDRNA2_99913_c0_seq1.p1  ORF type:complete len:794 (-),score=131.63 gnl/MRDRNA2_/MRDRNA2_99913_c0_seq1:218-2386(-)
MVAAVVSELHLGRSEEPAGLSSLMVRLDEHERRRILGELLMMEPALQNLDVLCCSIFNNMDHSIFVRECNQKSPIGNSPLHFAARQGDLHLCQRLVDAGALIKAKNAAGQTPIQLAHLGQHDDVLQFLQSRQVITTVRGGTGDALAQALDDDRRVIRVGWYTIPLDGGAGTLGISHSLLKVTVEGETGSYNYAIEKASIGRAQCLDMSEQFRNGVYISHWKDVACNVEEHALHYLHEGDIVEVLRMRNLRAVAIDIGEYDVISCNCHHTALAVFNTCAKECAQIRRMPNEGHMAVARMLRGIGFDVAKAEPRTFNSCGPILVASDLCCESRYKLGAFPVDSDNELDPLIHVAAHLANWIYIPDQEGIIHFKNLTGEVLVIYVEETGQELRMEACATGQVRANTHSVHVLFNRVGLFGFTGRHTRLGRRELFSGRSYRVNHGVEGLSCDADEPLPSEMQIEQVDCAQGANLVQWAAVTTNDTIFITFRGTEHTLDILVDASFISYDEAPHGIRMHGGVFNALHQRRHHVVDMIAEKVQSLRESRPHLCKVVLTGHSLGGMYAIGTALSMMHKGMDVTEIITFACSQALVPDWDSKLFRSLSEKTTTVIHAYDFAPRLPSCTRWIEEVIPRSGAKNIGPFQVNINTEEKLKNAVATNREVMADFDQLGTLVFITKGSRGVKKVKCSRDGSHREVLEQPPDPLGDYVLEQHRMAAYLDALAIFNT